MVDLKGLYRVKAKGHVYWYAWRGGPRIAAPHGTPAFAAEYAAHHAARKGGDKERISGLIVEWKKSDAWALPPEHKDALAASTRKNWKGPLGEIQSHWGTVLLSEFDRPEVRRHVRKWLEKWKAKPRTADMHRQVLSVLLSFGVDEGRLRENPIKGKMKNAYSSDRADIIWTEDDTAQLAGHAPAELMYALGLACMTGLRQSDLLKLSWSHVTELAIEMRTGKSGGQRTAVIPMYDELREFLAAIPKRSTRVLTNTEGQPWRSGFTSSWNKALTAAGLKGKLHFHDARGTFATWAYEMGVFTVKELAEMLAWSEDKVERIINRYVRRDALLRDKIRRIDEARKNTSETKSAKPTAKPARSRAAEKPKS